MDLDIEAYAAIMAELAAAAGDGRAAVLARRGLDEERWDALDTFWQDRLSEAMADDSDGVSPLLASYTAAYDAARRALDAPISLQRFAEATRLLQVTGDLRSALARAGISFAAFVRGSEHWSPRIAREPEIERQFSEALRGR